MMVKNVSHSVSKSEMMNRLILTLTLSRLAIKGLSGGNDLIVNSFFASSTKWRPGSLPLRTRKLLPVKHEIKIFEQLT